MRIFLSPFTVFTLGCHSVLGLVGSRAGIMQIARQFLIKCAVDWAHSGTAVTLCTPGQLGVPKGLIAILIIFEISILLSTFVSAENLPR